MCLLIDLTVIADMETFLLLAILGSMLCGLFVKSLRKGCVMKPRHLFIDGSAEFPNGLVWKNYSQHHKKIRTLADLKATLREGSHTNGGGYPLMLMCDEGSVYSFEGVREHWREIARDYITGLGTRVVACEINWECSGTFCDLTGKPIDAAYGD
jgi:hypothetical protein